MSRGSCSFPISAGTSAALAQGELQRGFYCLDSHKGPESVCGVCAQVCGRDAGWAALNGRPRGGSLNTLLPFPLALLPFAFRDCILAILSILSKGIPVGHVCPACQNSFFPTRLIVCSACLTYLCAHTEPLYYCRAPVVPRRHSRTVLVLHPPRVVFKVAPH